MDELAKVNINGKEYHLKDETARQGSGGNVAYDEAQNLTDEQKAQARENIGAQPKGNYLTEHQSLEGYAKTTDIPTKPEDIGAQPAGNYLTEVPEGYAKTEDIPTDAEIIQLIKNNAPESSGGGIAVTGAKVGQTVKISAVDENGVPTAWLPADFPSGGGGAENDNDWEIINTLTFEEEGITSFTIDKDKNGNPFELSDIKLLSGYQTSLGGTWDGGARTRLLINGEEINPNVGKLYAGSRHFMVIAFLVNGRIYFGNSNFERLTQTYERLEILPVVNLNDNSITSIGVRIDWPGTGYFAVGYKLTLWGRRKK